MATRPYKLTLQEKQALLERFWKKDPSLWSEKEEDFPAIVNRLGWMDVIPRITPRLDEIKRFGNFIKEGGFDRVCLLGMGGSSLFALVLSQVFGPGEGYPPLAVLDTTDPQEVERIETSGLERTFFIVSSKSGTTTEVRALFNFFWEKLKGLVPEPGKQFAAITDPETPLEKLAEEKGFRYCFLNFQDIGGRYSALSYFGLIPAAALGVDIDMLLDRASDMVKSCGPDVSPEKNPGYLLGEFLGENGSQSRDKLTLLMDKPVRAFALWLEQLIAESSGKDTLGFVPIVGESTGIPGFYGGERTFVYTRMKSTPAEQSLDAFVKELVEADFPTYRLELGDLYDLGGMVFLW